MSDMLSIAASGLRAYQTALTTVSENVANAGTAGYARRTTNVREVIAPATMHGWPTGLGVTVNGVSRAGDLHRSAEVRTATADLARSQTGVTWLQRIEESLSQNKLSDKLTAFFASAKAVAADPSSQPPRAAMLEAASSAAAAFSATGSALASALGDLDGSAGQQIGQLNALAASLAQVNSGLGRAMPGSSGAAALADERDRLLEAMSGITDLDVTLDTSGRALVRAGGASGPILVQGVDAGRVGYSRNDEGAVAFTLSLGFETTSFTPNGGALAGLGESAQRIAGAATQIAALAQSFAEGVNAVQAAGRDLDGNPGAPMFAIGDPASQLSLALADPRGIAAAAPAAGTRDASNLAGLDTLRTTARLEEGVGNLTASNGTALSARQSVVDAQTAIRDSAVSARDSIAGVNVDEEAVDLLRFQQAYQASSRVIQIARETLQSILDIR
ncbi:MAG: flagellar hook-associated protein FlgK [Sphingomonas sp.]|uniref:flagellar hook-associated protein FlgK n=1 Tax=Sphingomonas sp. TaxID=28214 RepID=UPI001B09DF1A|nr:flagellar hook-associated protein FlgK [Sphingomonas sp.]MBO9622006.1 flagellar hook-associated protein FlgK [Sphingomonas sp.]